MDHVTVAKILISDCLEPRYIICYWGDELKICLIYKEEYWQGVFPVSNYKHFYENLCISEEKYRTHLKEALAKTCDSKYIFNFDKVVLKWKIKNENNVFIIHGKCELKDYFPEGGNQMLIDTLLDLNKHKEDMVIQRDNETLELGRQLRVCIEMFEEYSESKKNKEAELYKKFLQLLNTKKQKISHLEEFYYEVKSEKGTSHPSDSPKIKLLDSERKTRGNVNAISDSEDSG